MDVFVLVAWSAYGEEHEVLGVFALLRDAKAAWEKLPRRRDPVVREGQHAKQIVWEAPQPRAVGVDNVSGERIRMESKEREYFIAGEVLEFKIGAAERVVHALEV